MNRFTTLFGSSKPLIGMIHLPPLPDYQGSPGIEAIIESALNDLRILEEFGFEGALIENEYDQPHRAKATPETIEAMKAVTKAVMQHRVNCKIGVEILLNDPKASLDVAKSADADFIRTDYFVDPMSRPEYGEFDIDPQSLIEYRQSIGAEEVLILADIQVKYATMLIERPLSKSAELAEHHQADAIVISGDATGDAPVIDDLEIAGEAANIPVIIGSGLDAHNGNKLLEKCDGAIVGTALMKDKHVSAEKVSQLVSALGRAS